MKTIEEELLEAGYGHRPSRIYGRREVFAIGTGEIAGQFTAQGAVEFLQCLAS